MTMRKFSKMMVVLFAMAMMFSACGGSGTPTSSGGTIPPNPQYSVTLSAWLPLVGSSLEVVDCASGEVLSRAVLTETTVGQSKVTIPDGVDVMLRVNMTVPTTGHYFDYYSSFLFKNYSDNCTIFNFPKNFTGDLGWFQWHPEIGRVTGSRDPFAGSAVVRRSVAMIPASDGLWAGGSWSGQITNTYPDLEPSEAVLCSLSPYYSGHVTAFLEVDGSQTSFRGYISGSQMYFVHYEAGEEIAITLEYNEASKKLVGTFDIYIHTADGTVTKTEGGMIVLDPQ